VLHFGATRVSRAILNTREVCELTITVIVYEIQPIFFHQTTCIERILVQEYNYSKKGDDNRHPVSHNNGRFKNGFHSCIISENIG